MSSLQNSRSRFLHANCPYLYLFPSFRFGSAYPIFMNSWAVIAEHQPLCCSQELFQTTYREVFVIELWRLKKCLGLTLFCQKLNRVL